MKRLSVLCTIFAFCISVFAGKISALEDVATENIRKLALANNELAFNLHRKLVSGSTENVFFSPLSISTAFGMLSYGARGDTAEELRKVMGYEKAGLLNDLVHDTFNHYFKDVLKSGNSSEGYVLNSANAILADKSVGLLEEYKQKVEELYRAVVRNVDFSRKAPKIVKEINDWVKEKTNGKIEKLFDDLSPATALVLLNAVYFKGAWNTPFDSEETKEEIFFNNGLLAEAKNVPMMHMEAEFSIALTGDSKVVELPYKGQNVSMLIMVPNNRDGLQAIEKNMTPEKLKKIQEYMFRFNVKLALPKFKLEFEKELSGDLQSLGANQIFSSGADFSGMTTSGDVSVSQVHHKAVIEVNEKGSEAAAVTDDVMSRSGRMHIKADHPFLFAIVEKGSKSNMILFMGRVNKL